MAPLRLEAAVEVRASQGHFGARARRAALGLLHTRARVDEALHVAQRGAPVGSGDGHFRRGRTRGLCPCALDVGHLSGLRP